MPQHSVLRLTAVFAALSLGLAARAAPAPYGHDLILSRLIHDAAQGRINYQTLAPGLRDAVHAQAAVTQSQLTALGALKTVTFVSADQAGAEYYRTAFEHGALDWAFSIDGGGLIANAAYRPAPADPA